MTACLRTAFTKGGKGGFKDTMASDLVAGALKGIIDRSKIDPALVEDVCVGTVLAPGGGATEMAISVALQQAARSVTGVEGTAYQAITDAMEFIPQALVQNGGSNSSCVLTELRVCVL